MRGVRVGTRGSKLALWQAEHVCAALRSAWPGLECEIRIIRTTGDIAASKPLHEVGDKAMFTKELDQALLEGEVDLCVHSMKDVPTSLPDGCAIAAVCERADARDVLVCGSGLRGVVSLSDLPRGARVGTGSLRRAVQLKVAFPHVEPLSIRGNVDTRLAKADGPDFDCVVLAAAGVIRMGCAERISAFLPVEQMVPAAGQGAIGIEVRSADEGALELVSAVDDPLTHECVAAERRVLAAMGGSCKVPVGVHARVIGGEAVVDAVALSLDGQRAVGSHRRAALCEGCFDLLADEVIGELSAKGAGELLAELLGMDGRL